MKVGYVVNQYPAISHTFIRREINALEEAGVSVSRYAIRRAGYGVVSDEDRVEASKTRWVVGAPLASILFDGLSALVTRPLGSLRALWRAIGFAAHADVGVLRHGAYFVEALVIARWMQRDNVRHLHAHFGTNSATVALLAAEIAGGAFSMTVHGSEEFDRSRTISLKTKIECAAFVAGVSSFGISQLRRLVDFAHWRKLVIVRCGLEDSYFNDAGDVEPEPGRLVSVGRLTEQKGQMTLIEAAGALKAAGVPFRLRLVGDGELRRPLQEKVAALGLSDHVDFVGWLTPAQVRAEVQAAQVFVLPSYAEGLPVSIMEAFAVGTPVVATWIAGVPELVEPGRNGWLAPAADAQALSAALQEALSMTPALRMTYGAHGRERTRERHSVVREAAKLKALFETVIREGRPL